MGTWTRNLLLPKADHQAVRDRLVNWLERKGFDPSPVPSVFTDKNDDERALCLVSNAHWTVVLYREAFSEGDRMLTELLPWPILLEVVIADSDVWAYDLIESGELTASFNSNPRHFGGDEQKLPRNGDPERLCQALGLKGLESQIERLQRRRSLFSDFPCRAFCRLIGASAGALHFADFDFRPAPPPGPREMGGWKVETLFFERRRPLGEAPDGPILHSLVVRQFEPREREPAVSPEFVRAVERQARLLRLLFLPLTWIGYLLGPVIRWQFRKQAAGPTRKKTGDALLDALSACPVEKAVVQDGWLIHRGYGLRLRATARPPREAESFFSIPGEIFQFAVDGHALSALAIRPEQLRRHFLLAKGMTPVGDENFSVQGRPARILAHESRQGDTSAFHYFWFVELERFVVSFSTTANTALTPASLASIRDVIRTLEPLAPP